MIKFGQTHKNLLLLLVIGTSFFFITKTVAITNPYSPGATRDPACAPGEENCTVDIEKDLYKENPSGLISNTTSGTNSITIGSSNTASGVASIAIGSEYDGDPGAVASGDYSVAVGHGSVASGDFASALGIGAVSSGDYSTALGYLSSASGVGSAALGVGSAAPSFREISIGSYPTTYTPLSTTGWNSSDRLFSIGNGSSSVSRSNLLTVTKIGNVTLTGNTIDFNFAGYTFDDNSGFGNISFNKDVYTNAILYPASIEIPRGTGGEGEVDFSAATQGMIIPQGETSQRPSSNPVKGTVRYNNDTSFVEYYNGSSWINLTGYNFIAEETADNIYYEAPRADGFNSMAIGPNSSAPADEQIVIGPYPNTNDADEDNIFTIANGAGHGLESNAVIVTGAGEVGIGNFNDAGGIEHPLQMYSGAHVTAGGVWTDASDRNLKDNIEDLNYGLNEIKELRPRSFTYKIDGSESIGFIAQEIEDVIPEVVSGSEGKKGVAYGQLVAVLTNAVQELSARVELLEDELNVTPAEEPEPIDTPEEEEVAEEEVAQVQPNNQVASIIETSNEINLTNSLLIAGLLLLIINLVVMIKQKN